MQLRILFLTFVLGTCLSAQTGPSIVDVTLMDYPYDYTPPQELGIDSPPAVAQGSIFKIWGLQLGPAEGVGTESADLARTLADVRVELTLPNGAARDLPLYWVGVTQINVVMASDAPIGLAHLRVIHQGVASAPFAIKVVKTRPRIFDWRSPEGPKVVAVLPVAQVAGADGSRRLVRQLEPAKPGDTVVLWVTGLGPRSDSLDELPLPERIDSPLEVYLGDHAGGRRLGRPLGLLRRCRPSTVPDSRRRSSELLRPHPAASLRRHRQ